MNQDSQLKLVYRIIIVIIVLLALAVASYPIGFVAEYLATLLNIPEGAPVKDQENGGVWFILFILEAVIVYLLIYILLAILICKLKGWPASKSINVFIKSKYPEHWYKVT